MSKIDEFGGPHAYNHYAVGWAHAMNTPYQWTKQVASHFGGTRNGTIVHWPAGIKAKGEIRSQFSHVHRHRADDSRSRGPARADDREQRAAGAVRGRQHALCVQRREGPRAPRDAVLRNVLQPRHLPQGLDRGDPAQHALGHVRSRCRPSRTIVWELYDTNTDWTQARDFVEDDAGETASTCSNSS